MTFPLSPETFALLLQVLENATRILKEANDSVKPGTICQRGKEWDART